jgi:archaemetzincin
MDNCHVINWLFSWKPKNVSECMVDSLPADPPLGYVIELQPLGDFSQEKAKLLRFEFVKQLALIFPDLPKPWLEASIYVSENKEVPASFLYKPRNRYWAGAILKMLHDSHSGKPDIVTIGLTNRDISTSIHGQYNFGVMGLSHRPGDACVVSTYRLKRKNDLWKVAMHEFLHSRGMPHCKTISSVSCRTHTPRILST